MDINRKLELLAAHVTSIATHDDAPQDEVAAALATARGLVEAAITDLPKRREGSAQ